MKAKYLALWGAVLTAGALLAETADWCPAERWRGFNLLAISFFRLNLMLFFL